MRPITLYDKIVGHLTTIAGKKYFWWTVLGFLFLPLIALAFCNHPSIDDYCYVVQAAKAGYWQSQWDLYNTTNGRYAASFFLVSDPLLFGSFLGYRLINILLLVLTGCSFLFFVKSLMNKKQVDLSVLIISVSILFFYLAQMPSMKEGFYWMAGAITYQVSVIAMLTVFLLLSNDRQPPLKNWKLSMAVLLCIVICGSNETSMLEFIYILIACMLFEYATVKSIPRYYYLILPVALASALVVVLAPSNAIRASYFTGNRAFVLAFTGAITASFSAIGKWLQNILIVLVLILPFLKKVVVDLALHRRITCPLLLLYPLFIFGILVVGHFPAFYGMGGMPVARTLNVVYLLFFLSCLHYSILLIVYAKQQDVTYREVPVFVQWILVFILTIHLFPVNNLRTAYMDLISGRAMAYHKEMNARYEWI
ncbi:MAG: hypothetical protein H7282_12360, partial [Cytophagaceae bacterium]|nr:hypothetical protein [Cytophagaceae bacterium]